MKTIFATFLFSFILKTTVDPTNKEVLYNLKLKQLMDYKFVQREKYLNASNTEKEKIRVEVAAYLHNYFVINLFPCWYGTAWDFNGVSRIPGQGKIACGYFVTTLIKDAGFLIYRVHWAQQYAQYYINRFCKVQKTFSNSSITEVEKWLNNQPDGLYIVGLDNHCGFLSKLNGEFAFIHSNYYKPEVGVMSENINGHNPFYYSKLKVLGKMFDGECVTKWLLDEWFMK